MNERRFNIQMEILKLQNILKQMDKKEKMLKKYKTVELLCNCYKNDKLLFSEKRLYHAYNMKNFIIWGKK